MTPYTRQQYLHEQIKLWHMTDARKETVPPQFSEWQFIGAIAGGFLAGAAFTALFLFLLAMEK